MSANSSRMEIVLSGILRWGVILGALLISAGIVLLLATKHGGYGAGLDINKLLFFDASSRPHRFYPTDFKTIIEGLTTLKPFGIIDFGVIVLIATPILRVGASAVLFGLEKDKAYVGITLVVLLILIFSLISS